MTPEERALRVVEKMREPFANSPAVALLTLIASAIREAQASARDDALEEAAGICERAEEVKGHEFRVNGEPLAADDGCIDFMSAKQVNAIVTARASAIRTLKSKQEG